MNRRDRGFVKEILGTPGNGRRWRALFRKGSLLTLTRVEAGPLVPELYRPQRGSAKIILQLVRFGERCRLPVPGSRVICFEEGDDCLVSKLEARADGKILTLLLGNPLQEQRRFLGLCRLNKGMTLSVLKCGFTPQGIQVIENEEKLLNEFGGKVDGVPKLQAVYGGKKDGYRAFALRYAGGRSASTEEALQQLWHWSSGEPRLLKDFQEWGEVRKFCREAGIEEERVEQAGQIELVETLYHGDYAPWNLFFDQSGKLWAFDWEAGQAGGIPGLDWVHYLYQYQKHLAGRDFRGAMLRIRRRLNLDDSRAFLKKAGWDGNFRWLLVSYLATHWLIEESERPLLIREVCSV